LIPSLPKGAENINEAWHSTFGTLLSQLRHLDITGCGLKWDCAEGFHRQCYHLVAAWVWEYSKQVMLAQVQYCTCLMCEITKGALMGHSIIRPLDYSSDQHGDPVPQKFNIIDALSTFGVEPIRNQFW
jgi:hypothetical protein